MDSGNNSGSISSSGDEEYDSRVVNHTLLPSLPFLNNNNNQNQFNGSIINHPQSSSLHNHNSLFDLSSSNSYLHHAFSHQPQPHSSNPNSSLNLDTPINPPTLQGMSMNQSLLRPQVHNQCVTIREQPNARAVASPINNNNNNNNAVRNSRKRTRASRRAPTTVLTTDTTNFRAMVQEFTGIPSPPFSSSSYSRRLDLLGGSSTLRSSTTSSHHLDTTTTGFYPLRPSPQKVHHITPLLPSSLTNIESNISNDNYQLLHHDLGLPYHPFVGHPPPHPLHLGNPFPFSEKSHGSLSLEDLNAHFVTSEGKTLRSASNDEGGRKDPLESFDVDGFGKVASDGNCKLNFSASASSGGMNNEKNLENNNNDSARGEGGVDSWICSSD